MAADVHWSDDPAAVADLLVRARQAVAARIGLEDPQTARDVVEAFRHAGEQPCVPDVGRVRGAVDAICIRHPGLAADLRPLVERLYTLSLLARG